MDYIGDYYKRFLRGILGVETKAQMILLSCYDSSMEGSEFKSLEKD